MLLYFQALKDIWEDRLCHRYDNEENNRLVQVVSPQRPHPLITTKRKDIWVGNVIQLGENEEAPADLVLLATSNLDGVAFVDTVELDGSTQLKMKLAPKETKSTQQL